MTSRGHALSRDELIRTLTAYTGVTTADGAGDGTTLIDSALIDNASISPSGIPGKAILIMSGNARGEDKGAESFNNGTGAVTLIGTGFSAQIMAGTIYRIINISSVETLIAALALEATLGTHDTDIKALIATIAAYLDTEITDIKTQTDKIAGKMLFSMDFWSDLVEEVAVTGTKGTVTITGGNVAVADLPDTATIVRAVVMMKFRMVENTHATIANKLDATDPLPMQVDDVANTGMLTCIDFVDDAFHLAAATREGGDVIIGDIDVAARVNGNDTYDFQWLDAKADQNNLQFNDVQMGIRIWYSV